MDVFATKDQGNAEPQRFWNREDAKGAKGFIYFLIGTDDQKKNHALLWTRGRCYIMNLCQMFAYDFRAQTASM